MRFFKGSKVEVLQEAEVPLGSWRPGEIVSGNGHTYLVRYDPSPVDSCVAAERVPRRLMRPCPPRADDSVCWNVGIILEAFDSYSWKVAEVVKVLGKNHYLVRLLGSSLELRVHASDLRLRKLWQDGKWIEIRKYISVRGRSRDGNFGCKLGKNEQLDYAGGRLQLGKQNAFDVVKSRGMKRKLSSISTCPLQWSEITKRVQTPRDGGPSKLVDKGSLRLAQKVDAVDSPCVMLGEKYMHAYLNMKKVGDVKTNLSGVNADTGYKWHTRATGALSDTESTSSSVGSSSPNSKPCRSHYYSSAYQSGDACSRTDGAEASISEREISEHDNDGLREEAHLLELHAYRATLLALSASESISWDQETLLTNLRLTLNISTDEHLAELRNLSSQAVTSR